jgi:hypothetical protein
VAGRQLERLLIPALRRHVMQVRRQVQRRQGVQGGGSGGRRRMRMRSMLLLRL